MGSGAVVVCAAGLAADTIWPHEIACPAIRRGCGAEPVVAIAGTGAEGDGALWIDVAEK